MDNIYISRLERVRKAMDDSMLERILVTEPESIRYLTGITVWPGERLLALLVTGDSIRLFLNRLFHVPETDIPCVWYSDTDDQIAILASYIPGRAMLGVDKAMTARYLMPLINKLYCPVVLGSGCVDWVRAVKDERELELMAEASRINDQVVLAAREFITEGVTEKQVAERIIAEYSARGCSGPSFDPIVSFGKNAADPHHMPDDTVVVPGDCVLFDIGGLKDGYCSDMTRTYFYKEATEEYTKIHDLVRSANEAAEAIIHPGVRLCDIDAAARDVIAAAGYGEYFTHRLGHFIGQSIHEYGDVSAAFTKEVEPGMVFSIEPGVYLPGKFGVRVEDLVAVTEDGCRILNSAPKGWEIIG